MTLIDKNTRVPRFDKGFSISRLNKSHMISSGIAHLVKASGVQNEEPKDRASKIVRGERVPI